MKQSGFIDLFCFSALYCIDREENAVACQQWKKSTINRYFLWLDFQSNNITKNAVRVKPKGFDKKGP